MSRTFKSFLMSLALTALAMSGARADAGTTPAAMPSAGITRWIDLQEATLRGRYLFVKGSNGAINASQFQHGEALQGRLKLDRQANYTIHAGVFPGNHFIAGWNNSGWGRGEGSSNLYLKRLYFSAKPVKGLEAQYGGIGFLRGAASDITTYSGDGFLMGERLRLTRPDRLFFDEIAVTYGYLGDVERANINRRFHRLKRSNYHQFLVGKNIGRRAAVSVDYTFAGGADTTRQAVRIHTPELRVIDSFRFENYQRMNARAAYGFAAYGEKAVHQRWSLGGGFATIDPNYGGLNADRFVEGKRWFLTSGLRLHQELMLSLFVTRAVSNPFPVSDQTHFDLALSYDLLKALSKEGSLRRMAARK